MSSPAPGDPGAPTDGDATGARQHEPPSGGPSGPRVTREDVKDLARLRRSSSDRKVAGVAAGIGRHLDIDPVVVRIAFVVLVFFGGGGLLLYGACWLFVPQDDTQQAVVNVDGRSRTAILLIAGALAALAAVGDSLGGFGFPWPLAIAAVAVAIYLAVKQTSSGGDAATGEPGSNDAADPADAAYARYRPPPPAPDPRRTGPVWFWFTLALAAVAAGVVLSLQLAGLAVPHATYGAVVVAACGVMLVVGAFYGRSGGLIPLGVVAALTTLVLSVTAPLSDQMFSVGQTKVTPDRLSELDDSYSVGMGEIKIDLTGLEDLDVADDQDLDLDVGVGHIQVVVPENGLNVEVAADIGLGEIKVFGDTYSDVATDEHHDGGVDAPVLSITADGRIGQIEIINPEDLP